MPTGLGARLEALIYQSHFEAMNGGHHIENELNEIEDKITELEKRMRNA